MDFSKLSNGAKLVLGGTIAFLIVSIFNWQEIEIANIATAGRSMWAGWGTLAGLLAIALLVWEGLRLANINVTLPVTPAMASAFIAILLLITTILKFLVDNEFRTFWAWLGLLLAIAITAGAVMNMQAAGQSFSDMRDSLTAGAAAATAAARSAADSVGDKKDDAAAAPAPAAPAAPEPPAEPVHDATEAVGDAPAHASADDAPSEGQTT
jgi:hypothetical protein